MEVGENRGPRKDKRKKSQNYWTLAIIVKSFHMD